MKFTEFEKISIVKNIQSAWNIHSKHFFVAIINFLRIGIIFDDQKNINEKNKNNRNKFVLHSFSKLATNSCIARRDAPYWDIFIKFGNKMHFFCVNYFLLFIKKL